MRYEQFRYLFPPRAATKVNPLNICRFDEDDYVAQVKYNGSCSALATDGSSLHFHTRYGAHQPHDPKWMKGLANLRDIHTGNGWMVVTGELMNKAKLDEKGNVLKGFVIWDILVYGGKYLVGSTLQERIDLMENLWPTKLDNGLVRYHHLSYTNTPHIYRAPVYRGYFDGLYRDVVKTDAYEGLVFKKLTAKLEHGWTENNNKNWQQKVRKQTSNYRY